LAFPNRHAKPGKRDATRSRGVCVTLL
jgi:hypothetical protein